MHYFLDITKKKKKLNKKSSGETGFILSSYTVRLMTISYYEEPLLYTHAHKLMRFDREIHNENIHKIKQKNNN